MGVLEGMPTPASAGAGGGPLRVATAAAQIFQGGSIDGSIAYRQFGESDNPYDPIFVEHRNGNVAVEPLRPVKPVKDAKPGTGGARQPGPPPRSA